jgi:hypothetical protein
MTAPTDNLSLGSIAGRSNARSSVLDEIFRWAKTHGIEEAVSRFGGPLSDTEKMTLRTLRPEEIDALISLQDKLATIAAEEETAANNNNNNDNTLLR